MFGTPTDHQPLEWDWVEDQLSASGTYWVTPGAMPVPHPRPVWGVWVAGRLCLTIGSPVVARELQPGRRCTVHLPSSADVVIVEGEAVGSDADPDLIAAYDSKYDWQYDVDAYGPLTIVRPHTVSAWVAAGPAGRDGFVRSGRWNFDDAR